MFKQGDVGKAVKFCYAYLFAKVADCLRGVSPSSHSRKSRHAGVVPAVHYFFGNKLLKLALAHHSVRQVQARKFVLARMDF